MVNLEVPMGCQRLTYYKTFSPLRVVCDNLNVSLIRHENGYRYSFQGQESDDEVKGEGNSVNYKYRMHSLSRKFGNPRVGSFFAVDPDFYKYPFMSSYCFAGNDPIRYLDKDGRGPIDPETGRETWAGLTEVTNWELLYVNSLNENAENRDWGLFVSSGMLYAHYDGSSGTAWNDGPIEKPGRVFKGDYNPEIKGEPTEKHKKKDILKEASQGEGKTYFGGNFHNIQEGSRTGNYIFGKQITNNSYLITTVENGIMKEKATFDESDGVYSMTKKVQYTIKNKREVEVEKVMSFGMMQFKYTEIKTEYDLEIKTTNYNDEGEIISEDVETNLNIITDEF